VLTIATPLSTVAEADRIVVLEQGEWLNRAPMTIFWHETGRYAQAVATPAIRKRNSWRSRASFRQGYSSVDRFGSVSFFSTRPVIFGQIFRGSAGKPWSAPACGIVIADMHHALSSAKPQPQGRSSPAV